jgi:TetR/AcrR family hemagglutinin/protease transcriptional regulator
MGVVAEAGVRRRLPPEERRAQLLEVAVRVFASNGLGQARHAEIAREAGVAVSTVFLYFPTREGLVDAVLSEVERVYLEMVEEVHSLGLPARTALERHVQSFIASLDAHLAHALVWLDWSTSFRHGVWQRFLGFMERIVELVEDTIRRGQREGAVDPSRDAHTAARLCVGAAQTLVHMKLVGMDSETIADFSRTALDTALGRSSAF